MSSNTKVELPDINDMLELISEIKHTTLEKELKEIELKDAISGISRKVRTEEEYFENGRPPAMNYIDTTYAYSGLNGELIPIRMKLAELSSELEHKKLLFQVSQNMIDIWRSQEASKRIAVN